MFLADVEAQLVGDDQVWDRIAIVRYPTRRSFLEMQDLPEYAALHEHKDAGMASTFVITCRRSDWPALPTDAPPLDAVPHPSTPEDGPVVLLHVLRYHDGRRSPDMELYQDAAGRIALAHGVRIRAWFDVEGTVVGDGRQWDEVRVNVFPSRAAFEAVARKLSFARAADGYRGRAVAPVTIRIDPGPLNMMILPRALAISPAASAVAEAATSTIASTP